MPTVMSAAKCAAIGGNKTAGPSAGASKDQTNHECGRQASTALVQVGDREVDCGAANACEDRSVGPVLKYPLHKPAIDQFFADRYRDDQREKREALDVILRK